MESLSNRGLIGPLGYFECLAGKGRCGLNLLARSSGEIGNVALKVTDALFH